MFTHHNDGSSSEDENMDYGDEPEQHSSDGEESFHEDGTDNDDMFDSDSNGEPDSYWLFGEDHYQEQPSSSENSDSNSDDSDSETELADFSVDDVLTLLRDGVVIDANGRPAAIYRSPIDYDVITTRTDHNVLKDAIHSLFRQYIAAGKNPHFFQAKNLMELGEIEIDDVNLLEEYTHHAVDSDDHEALDFFLENGGDTEEVIQYIISEDNSGMLSHLNVDVDVDIINEALDANAEESLIYFLNEDFSLTSQTILNFAVNQRSEEWVIWLCKEIDADQVYDLIKYTVTKINGNAFIDIFFEYFEASDLMDEIQANDDDGVFDHVLPYAKKYLTISEYIQLASISKLTISDSMLKYPSEGVFNGDKILGGFRDKLDRDIGSDDAMRAAANFVGAPLHAANRYLTNMPFFKFPTDKSGIYFRSLNHSLTNLVKSKAYVKPHNSLPEAKAITKAKNKTDVSHTFHSNLG